MSTPVKLPELGESVTEGTITRWLKQVGDTVEVDEPLLEVSTDKVDTEIPSPVAGTLLEIKAEEDETVEVGAELAIIGSGDAASGGSSEPQSAEARPKDEDNAEKKAEQEQQIAEEKGELPAGDETPESDKQDSPAAEEKQEVEPEAKGDAPYAPAPQGEPEPQRTDAAAQASSSGGSAASSEGGRDQSAYVTPLVRKMADQHGIDLGSVQGTGVGGRIRKQDVLDAAAAAQQAASAPAPQAAAAPAAAGAPPAAAAPSSASPSPLRGTTEPPSR